MTAPGLTAPSRPSLEGAPVGVAEGQPGDANLVQRGAEDLPELVQDAGQGQVTLEAGEEDGAINAAGE